MRSRRAEPIARDASPGERARRRRSPHIARPSPGLQNRETRVEQRVRISILINNCLTICFIDLIFTTSNDDRQKLEHISSTCRRSSAPVSPLPPPHPVIQFAGAIRRFLPSRRDREVPYGMKGGEQNGGLEEVL